MTENNGKLYESNITFGPVGTYSLTSKPDRRNFHSLLLISAVLIAFVYWSLISLLKYFYFQADVFDLGVNMQNLWSITHSNWTLYRTIFQFDYQGISFILFPLQYGGFPALLMFQSFIISTGAIAIYYISLIKGIDSRSSLFISVAYLLYFPVSGMTWFDFHFQSLFVPLFLFGYLSYVKKKYWLASIIFLISGIVRFPYAIFPFIFWALSLILEHKQDLPKRFIYFAIGNLLLYLLIIGSSYFLLHNGFIEIHTTQIINPFYNFPIKLITILVLLVPVLFIPIFSAKWYIYMAPYIFLLLFANNPIYEFPRIFTLQYSASFVPFIFLAVIEHLTPNIRINSKHSKWNRVSSKIKKLPNIIRHKESSIMKVTSVLLVTSLCSFVIYQAIGPIEILDQDGLTIKSITQFNQVEFKQFDAISALIPKNCSYILIQNNLPQFLPGPSGNNIRVPGDIGPNITFIDIANNAFPWTFESFKLVTPINYVIGELNTSQFYNKTLIRGFPTMANITTEFISSGYYGLLGIEGPFFVLARGYTGAPLIYEPGNVKIVF